MTQTAAIHDSSTQIAVRITLNGRVQGIGLRPAIARFAKELSLAGWIANTREGVQIHIEGPSEQIERFERELSNRLPATAVIESLDSSTAEPLELAEFQIVASSATADQNGQCKALPPPLSARVPVDLASCLQCLAETHSIGNRRFGYPFTSCTDCGPRYSIIKAMPYERVQTAMAGFALCPQCSVEYGGQSALPNSVADRRFHAQTNACPECGPQVWLRDSAGRVIGRHDDALQSAAAAIGAGRIIALRGLGGYQLNCDATSAAAVTRLRERKHRHGKPLAVMVASVEYADRLARLNETEKRLLSNPSGPIVIVQARDRSLLAAGVCEGLHTVGLMLPTTPLHALLMECCRRPLVVTSGNREREPLFYLPEEARQLAGIADLWLEHDRPICRSIDDSVVRVIAGQAATIRLARGYAPLPLAVQHKRVIVALGGHQKTALALANGRQAVLGPHLGDLDTVATCERYLEQLQSLRELYGVPPEADLVVDEHPDYFTTRWAEDQCKRITRVQHHHAHVVAGMLEHGWLDRQVLGVAFDGSGFGPDGTIWGGEFLLATATGYQRVGHLRPFRLPGGERAVREPWRVATALVCDALGMEAAARLGFSTADPSPLLPLIASPRLSPVTTSAGRLYDAVAALVLGVEHSVFEGQPAMLLEAACDPGDDGAYSIPIQAGQPAILDWRPMIRLVVRDRCAGVSPGKMAMRFHRGLAAAVAELGRRYPSLPIVLGGGVFQNRVLVELLAEQLGDNRQELGLPGTIPSNDGGLAAGQLAIALARTLT